MLVISKARLLSETDSAISLEFLVSLVQNFVILVLKLCTDVRINICWRKV
jgi:hypothetical protein